MSNDEIITKSAAAYLGITEDQAGALIMAGKFPAFHTYETWKQSGYQVRKGEHARFSAKIWKMTQVKTEDGQKAQKLIMKRSHFFSFDQVDKIQ